jgi:hypothetical protein
MMDQKNFSLVNDKDRDGEINFFVDVGHGNFLLSNNRQRADRISSDRSQVDHSVIQVGSGIGQSFLNIRFFQFRIFALQLIAVRINGNYRDHPTHSQPQPANARLPIHSFGITGYALKSHD